MGRPHPSSPRHPKHSEYHLYQAGKLPKYYSGSEGDDYPQSHGQQSPIEDRYYRKRNHYCDEEDGKAVAQNSHTFQA